MFRGNAEDTIPYHIVKKSKDRLRDPACKLQSEITQPILLFFDISVHHHHQSIISLPGETTRLCLETVGEFGGVESDEEGESEVGEAEESISTMSFL